MPKAGVLTIVLPSMCCRSPETLNATYAGPRCLRVFSCPYSAARVSAEVRVEFRSFRDDRSRPGRRSDGSDCTVTMRPQRFHGALGFSVCSVRSRDAFPHDIMHFVTNLYLQGSDRFLRVSCIFCSYDHPQNGFMQRYLLMPHYCVCCYPHISSPVPTRVVCMR